jgi:hypothetical protein
MEGKEQDDGLVGGVWGIMRETLSPQPIRKKGSTKGGRLFLAIGHL